MSKVDEPKSAVLDVPEAPAPAQDARHDAQTKAVFDRERVRDLFYLPPIIGVILIMPPFATIFVEHRSDGVPAHFIYIFVVWALLVLAVFVLSRWFIGMERTPPSPRPTMPVLRQSQHDNQHDNQHDDQHNDHHSHH